MTLEERITRLEDIEAIRYLQAKYQRCLDTRDFDGIASCFADDVKSAYGNGDMSFEGKQAVIGFLVKSMTLDMPSTHLIHGGEIDVEGETAQAKWYLEDFLMLEAYGLVIHGAAVYENTYAKVDGKWLIKVIGYKRVYEYKEPKQLKVEKKTFFDDLKTKKPEDLGDFGKYFLSTLNK